MTDMLGGSVGGLKARYSEEILSPYTLFLVGPFPILTLKTRLTPGP